MEATENRNEEIQNINERSMNKSKGSTVCRKEVAISVRFPAEFDHLMYYQKRN